MGERMEKGKVRVNSGKSISQGMGRDIEGDGKWKGRGWEEEANGNIYLQ